MILSHLNTVSKTNKRPPLTNASQNCQEIVLYISNMNIVFKKRTYTVDLRIHKKNVTLTLNRLNLLYNIMNINNHCLF